MSDTNILDFMRARFDRQDEMLRRIDARLDAIAMDITSLKVRMSSAEALIGHVQIGVAEVSSRLDRLDARMERIERRLDLVQAP
jgi:archaellum component FlaC